MTMSTLNEEGVMAVKTAACERLLASRVEMKLQVCCLWAAVVLCFEMTANA